MKLLATFATIVALQIVFPPVMRIVPCEQLDPNNDTCSVDTTPADPAPDSGDQQKSSALQGVLSKGAPGLKSWGFSFSKGQFQNSFRMVGWSLFPSISIELSLVFRPDLFAERVDGSVGHSFFSFLPAHWPRSTLHFSNTPPSFILQGLAFY